MGKDFDIVSSAIALIVFALGVYAALFISRKVSSSTNAATSSLKSRGIEVSEGKVSIKTDHAPVSREEQVQKSQAAVGAAARYVAERPQAFSVGAAAEDSPRGFRRTKKLD